MRLTITFAVLALVALALPFSEANAALTREVRPVTSFHAVRLVGSVDLVISQGDSESVSIEGESKQVRSVTTSVEDGVLVITYSPGWSLLSWIRVPDSAPRAVVTAKDLNRIAVEGSGDVRGQTLTAPDRFEIQVTGSGDVQIGTLAARSVDVRIAGSGDVRLAGAVLDEAVRIAGSGDFYGGDLKSATSKVSIAGSGDATVWVRDKLDVSLSGSGDLGYYGTPVISQSTSGSGSLKRLGPKS